MWDLARLLGLRLTVVSALVNALRLAQTENERQVAAGQTPARDGCGRPAPPIPGRETPMPAASGVRPPSPQKGTIPCAVRS